MQELVSKHREDLVLGVADETTENHRIAQETATKSIDHLRKELRSISYDRSVLDIQTRNLISDTKYEYRKMYKDVAEEEQEAAAAAVTAANKKRMSLAEQQLSERNGAGSKTSSAGSASGSVAGRRREGGISTSVQRANPNNLMVPSVRTGTLPPELRQLNTTPGDGANADVALYRRSTAATRSHVSAAKKKRTKSKSPSRSGQSVERVVESTSKLMNAMLTNQQMHMQRYNSMAHAEQSSRRERHDHAEQPDHHLYSKVISMMNSNAAKQQEQMLKAFEGIVVPLVSAQTQAAAAAAAAATAVPVAVQHTPIVRRQFAEEGDGYESSGRHGRSRSRSRSSSSNRKHSVRSHSRSNTRDAEDIIADLGYKLIKPRGSCNNAPAPAPALVPVPVQEFVPVDESFMAPKNIELMEPGDDIRAGGASSAVVETHIEVDSELPNMISFSSRKIRQQSQTPGAKTALEEKHSQFLAIQQHNEDINERRRQQSQGGAVPTDCSRMDQSFVSTTNGDGIANDTSLIQEDDPATPIKVQHLATSSTPPQVWCLAPPTTTKKPKPPESLPVTPISEVAPAAEAPVAAQVPVVDSASMHECFTKLISEVLANNRELATSNQEFFLQLLEQVRPKHHGVNDSVGSVGDSTDSAAIAAAFAAEQERARQAELTAAKATEAEAERIIGEVVDDLLVAAINTAKESLEEPPVVQTERTPQPTAAEIAVALVAAMKDMMTSSVNPTVVPASASLPPAPEPLPAPLEDTPQETAEESDDDSLVDVPSAYAPTSAAQRQLHAPSHLFAELDQRPDGGRYRPAEAHNREPTVSGRRKPVHSSRHATDQKRRPGLITRTVPTRGLRDLDYGVDSSLDSGRLVGAVETSRKKTAVLKGYMKPTRSSSSGISGSSSLSSSMSSVSSSINNIGPDNIGSRAPNRLLRSGPNAASLAFKQSSILEPSTNANTSALQIIDSDASEKWDDSSISDSDQLISVPSDSSVEMSRYNRPVTMDKRLQHLKVWSAANNSDGELLGQARVEGGDISDSSHISRNSNSTDSCASINHPAKHNNVNNKQLRGRGTSNSSSGGAPSSSIAGVRPLLVSNYLKNSATLKVQKKN